MAKMSIYTEMLHSLIFPLKEKKKNSLELLLAPDC